MDGVNNAFCSSKEEYEIARLTTKCAGLQGKIDDQAAEIEKYKALCDQMGNALETLWLAAPTDVQCNNMHHPKPKQHRYDEICPMVGEYHEAITGAGKTLKAWRVLR